VKVPPAGIYFPDADREWILARIDECLKTGALTLGEHGRTFAEEFAQLCGARYAVAVNSGTSSIEIILRAIGVEGREVIVPTNTFFATPAAVLHAGATVRFADCEPDSFALDVDSLRSLLSPRTAAVLIVHIGGIITPRIGEIRRVCDAAGVPLIEDAAHAHGSSFGGRMAGAFGLAASFSFYPTKVMTSGEGGMIVTDDERIYQEALIYRDQGKEGFTTNFHVRLGSNWRLSEPHAIIGLAQLRRLGEFIARRQEIAAVYDERLASAPPEIAPLRLTGDTSCNYYKYIVRIRGLDRAALKKMMRERFDVGLSGEVYEVPCHLQPVFAEMADGPLPMAEDLCANHVCLPVSAKMTTEDAAYVVESLNSCVAELAGAAVRGN
jgi:perosamine synthetase